MSEQQVAGQRVTEQQVTGQAGTDPAGEVDGTTSGPAIGGPEIGRPDVDEPEVGVPDGGSPDAGQMIGSGPTVPRSGAAVAVDAGAGAEPGAELEAAATAPPAEEHLRPSPDPERNIVPAPASAPPRPGPRAVPGPPRPAPPSAPAAAGPEGAAAHPCPVPAASAAPGRWGRVDAEGTIYVRTADGERIVGSWQAGAPQEGLAHFARRFDDLLTEAELLRARLTAGGSDPKHALSSAKAMRDGLADATVVGDVVGLRSRLDDLVALAEQAVGAARSARDAQRAAAVARKEALAVEAETLAVDATQWKQAGDRFKAILDEWRTIRGIDRKTDELLWKRFSKSREAFNRRRGSHFADLDRQRAGAKARKEELVVEAEKLADSEDWGPTAARYRDLMAEWKASGRAHKDSDDALWQRFRTAQDAFFARRAGTFAERDAELVGNAAAKKALLVEAEKIDISEPTAARAALRAVQERWEAIGKVPRDDIRALEARMRSVEERVREAADRQWRRADPEAEARVAQFRERVAQFEAQAAKAIAAGDTGRAEQAQAQATTWREWLATAEQAVRQR